jgi:protein-glutamine gamma-glutamyltransferase
MAMMPASSPTRRSVWPGWQRLPRDARDTLFLLFVIAWTVAPHIAHLPLWCSFLTAAVLLWRARLALMNSALPGRWVLVAVLIVAAVLTLWSYRTLLGKEAGVTLAVVLMALKTLELRARRDAFVVFFLGFFLILTHFLYSQSLFVAAAMLVSVWGLLTALVLAHMPVGQPSLRQAATLSARTAMLGAPIMALMFVLFPRIGPLWGAPQDGMSKTGLSNTMRMGSVAEIAVDDSIALRIRFDGPAPPLEAMYFRGPVLSRFDGVEWQALQDSFSGRPRPRRNLRTAGTAVRYEMTLEPLRLPVLPLLEATPEPPDIAGYRAFGLPDLQWRADRPPFERLRFDAVAFTSFQYGPTVPEPGLRDMLALPRGYNPRTLAWAAELRRDPRYADAEPRALAQALMQHIRSAGFSYTLAPGEYGRDAIDEFWFDRRAGFCEHFAAAFVVLMRALDVPARIVTGYQGADPEPFDGYYIVRQSTAHAWAEYWQPGAGWVRADPTAAIAPDRINRSRRLVREPGLVAGAIGTVSPAFLATLQGGWEALNNRWNQWVLNYSRGQQIDVLKQFGFQSPNWEDLALLLIGALSSLALAGAGWAWWDRHRIDPWVRQMDRVREALQALGVAAATHDTPRALAQRVRSRFGVEGEVLAGLLDALERQRYSRATVARPDGSLTREFVARTRALRVRAALFRSLALALVCAALSSAGTDAFARKKAVSSAPADDAPEVVTYGQREDVMRFGAELAERQSLDAVAVQAALQRARFVPAVARFIMPPPAGTAKNWALYRSRFIDSARIRAGVAFWRANDKWLKQAEERYGVPPEIVTGIVGVETIYGQQMGNFRVIDALATLAFDFPVGRRDRSEFFRDELEQFFVMCQRDGVDPLQPKGSFAGAMGMPQFMPTSVNRFAVDFDGNGQVDLRGSAADVIGSVAHYLAEFGWRRGLPTRFEVAVPVDSADRAQLLAPDILPSFTPAEFAARGALLDPAALATDVRLEATGGLGKLALVELQNGDAAPSYVAGTSNFYAVTRYNWSSYYAMAVIELGEAVARELARNGPAPR